MKSKKKLLLMGVGVMGALAMGVGATSTFAWYTATTAATLTTAASSFGVQTKDGELALSGLTINVAISPTSSVELTNSEGKVSGVLGDGSVATPIVPGPGNTAQSPYTGSLRFTSNPSNDQLQGLVGKTFVFADAVKANGNVKLIAVDDYDGTGTTADMTISFGASITVGSVVDGLYPVTAGATITFSLPNFVVRTNNEYGRECFTSAEASGAYAALAAKGQTVTATSDPGSGEKGDAYYLSATKNFKVHNGTSFVDGGYAHSEDSIGIVAGIEGE